MRIRLLQENREEKMNAWIESPLNVKGKLLAAVINCLIGQLKLLIHGLLYNKLVCHPSRVDLCLQAQRH